MLIHRIPSSSGRLKIMALNFALKKSVKIDVSTENGALAHSRKMLERWGRWVPPVRDVRLEKCTVAGMYCEVHVPRHVRSEGLIIYMHGGGFCIGSPRSHRNLIARIAKASGMRAISMDYRKAPEHPFPAALDDVIKVYEHYLSAGVSSTRIVFAGDSAGGNLVVSSLLKLKQLGRPMPAAACCISPWTDLSLSGVSLKTRGHLDLMLNEALLEQYAGHYTNGAHRLNETLSPLFGDLGGLPPLLVQVGAHEVLHDDAQRLVEKAHASGVDARLEIWDEMQHVWHYTSFVLQDGQRAIGHIGDFFSRHMQA